MSEIDMKEKTSSFQSVILELVRDKLNMMLCETFQLKEKVNFSNYEKLTKIVLKEISNSQINSPHLTPEQARKYINLLDKLGCHSEIGGGFKRPNSQGHGYCEAENPYRDSPFF